MLLFRDCEIMDITKIEQWKFEETLNREGSIFDKLSEKVRILSDISNENRTNALFSCF